MKMRKSIVAGALVSLLPAFALAAVMPHHGSGVPAAFSGTPTDRSAVSVPVALGAPVTSRFRTEPDPDQKVAQRVDLVKEQVKPLGGILVNPRSPTQASESRFLIQPSGHSQPQVKTNDERIAPATRVHVFWFFGGR